MARCSWVLDLLQDCNCLEKLLCTALHIWGSLSHKLLAPNSSDFDGDRLLFVNGSCSSEPRFLLGRPASVSQYLTTTKTRRREPPSLTRRSSLKAWRHPTWWSARRSPKSRRWPSKPWWWSSQLRPSSPCKSRRRCPSRKSSRRRWWKSEWCASRWAPRWRWAAYANACNWTTESYRQSSSCRS